MNTQATFVRPSKNSDENGREKEKTTGMAKLFGLRTNAVSYILFVATNTLLEFVS